MGVALVTFLVVYSLSSVGEYVSQFSPQGFGGFVQGRAVETD